MRKLNRSIFCLCILASLLGFFIAFSSHGTLASPGNLRIAHGTIVKENKKPQSTIDPHAEKFKQESTTISDGVNYKKMQTDSGVNVHVVLFDNKCGSARIGTYISDTTETTSSMAARVDAVVAVNGGYFNLSDGESASYVFTNGQQMCEPKHNMALVNNPGLRPFLPKIFNRSELRVLRNASGESSFRIQAHEDAVPEGWRVVDSLQAGPELLPKLTAREEAFIRSKGNGKQADSIGTNLQAARTACGITSGGSVFIVCVEGRRTKEFSEGMSLPDLASFMRRLGCVFALNFDGGSSSTMVLRLPGSSLSGENVLSAGKSGLAAPAEGNSQSAPVLTTVFGASPERKVKSILYVGLTKKPGQ